MIPLHLGSYDVIVGMDWLSQHMAIIECYVRTITLQITPTYATRVIGGDDHGIRGKLNHISEASLDNSPIKDIEVVREFPDVFPDDLPGLPPHRIVDFHIDLILGATPISRAPYRMASAKMVELKKQLDELLQKGYIRPSASPSGAPVLFVKKKDGSM